MNKLACQPNRLNELIQELCPYRIENGKLRVEN